MVTVIGHRGAAGLKPENTMSSFLRAVDEGCDMVELDVHLSRDGYVVIMHDDTVDRTTDGVGRISDLDLKELRSLDAGDGERIPTLSEVFELLRNRCLLNIELKGEGTAIPVSGMLEEEINSGRWSGENILISSFSPVSLKEFMDARTDVKTAILIDGNPGGAEEFAKQIGSVAVNPNYMFLEPDFIDMCRKLGLMVNTWTVNDPDQMERMISLGVDGIITDRPDLLVKKINRGKRSAPHE